MDRRSQNRAEIQASWNRIRRYPVRLAMLALNALLWLIAIGSGLYLILTS